METPPVLTGCEAVRAEINKYSNWDSRIMFAIAFAENDTCNPTRHNLTMSENHKVCVGSYGVLQVGCLHYGAGDNKDDLATNVRIAHGVWKGGGYRPWTQFKNGEYKKHL